MNNSHKNKTLATFLAALLGSIGAHRFYLRGWKDKAGWLHLATLPISIILGNLYFGLPMLLTYSLLVLSLLVSAIEALVLGLSPDEKWDAKFNPASGKTSDSSWLLALILVLTVAIGAGILIAVLARSFDLLYTGGAYG
ncbi:NINE protein [Undibacterium sp. TJN25]|uniref:NINE protein n=1 Tax=Undibacterium sp. TJN25 TaxID=3413056 RepID=UPI003BF451D1